MKVTSIGRLEGKDRRRERRQMAAQPRNQNHIAKNSKRKQIAEDDGVFYEKGYYDDTDK